MTRAEELSNAADKFTADKKDYVERCRWMDGAEWADKTMIDRACKWLKENAYFYVNDYTGSLNDDMLVDEFRRAMKS